MRLLQRLSLYGPSRDPSVSNRKEGLIPFFGLSSLTFPYLPLSQSTAFLSMNHGLAQTFTRRPTILITTVLFGCSIFTYK